MATIQEHLAGGSRTVTGRQQEDLCSKKTYVEEQKQQEYLHRDAAGVREDAEVCFVILTGDRAGLNF